MMEPQPILSTIRHKASPQNEDFSYEISTNYKLVLIKEALKEYSKQGANKNETLSLSPLKKNDQEDDVSIKETITKLLKAFDSYNTIGYFLSFQKWKGYVTKIHKDIFEAKLEDLSKSETYEIGEFEIKEVSPGDLDLLERGSVFYWSIGYSYTGTQLEKKSIIRFQRLSDWTEAEYDKAIDKGNELFDYFSE